ncbi:hypothetical protein GCM10010912_10310 [Paenibacillus albidus]|uniref:Uncharacterized protein n=1 Tax=Paenibacillus albidus TaxID=2041023 RepID=A0A917C3L9_9BACL|nr:hypothetical protein [Paenibacillus albidus]GGF67285.1 hypothetical protein GCM10010912_10310 [Paenibacillus albidus]
MANSITLSDYGTGGDSGYMRMSNGLTSVFIDVLVLSGSALAGSDREKEFVIWLAQRDQNVVGIGTVGFSLDELPWSREDFVSNQEFMLRVIDGALAKTGWEVLAYEPAFEYIESALLQFRQLVLAFGPEKVDTSHYEEWSAIEEDDYWPTIPPGYPQCSKHHVYLSCHGCVFCNYERNESSSEVEK